MNDVEKVEYEAKASDCCRSWNNKSPMHRVASQNHDNKKFLNGSLPFISVSKSSMVLLICHLDLSDEFFDRSKMAQSQPSAYHGRMFISAGRSSGLRSHHET